ncbi:unnamed protein product [Amaranthus hypochondriacus]
MAEHGELVGVVRGCIKEVGFGLTKSHLKIGYILGLRVSPTHRQRGIGHNLMKSIEEWLARNGAEYVYVATEENNVASRNLFTLKCHYNVSVPLQIYVLPVHRSSKKTSWNINVKKLQVNLAVSLYRKQIKCKDFYPHDMESILRGTPSLGTWVCYYNDEDWEGVPIKDHCTDTTRPRSWVVFSLWNSREVYKLQIQRTNSLHSALYLALSRAREFIFPCLKLPLVHGSFQKPFGFLSMYGVFGEGKRLRELMKAAWNFATKSAIDMDCSLVMTEISDSDPIKNYIPLGRSMLCIKDVWYFKHIHNIGDTKEEKTLAISGSLANVFVDPRDF